MRRLSTVCAVCCAAVVGCSPEPVRPTDDSRTKEVLGIWEWALTPGYEGGFSIVVFDGAEQSEVCSLKPGKAIRSIYLQKTPASDEYVVMIDAADGGVFGTSIPDPFDGREAVHRRRPVSHEGLWVLANEQDGVAGSEGQMSAYIAVSFTGEGGFPQDE